MMERSKTIIKTSFLGIAVNLILVAFKAFVGLVSGSIAVILDAVNNLSDALSSAITIVGTKLSGKRPDKKHPYGYGRIEYITSAIIAVIVLLAGVTSLRESFEKTIHPEAAEYTPVSLVIIGAAIIAKVLIGLHFKKVGKSVASDSLSASGADALFDSILSLGVLIAALLSIFFNVTLEGIIGLVISLFIIKAGIEMMLETYDDILGKRADEDVSRTIKKILNEEPEVLARQLASQVAAAGISSMVVTLGAAGAVWAEASGRYGFCPAWEVAVADTTGAGDAFFSGVAAGLTHGKTLAEACDIGTRLAASVICTQDNTCPRFRPEEFGLR